MKIAERWKESNAAAKRIVVLAAILLLQIGICAVTPTAGPWLYALLHVQAGDPLEFAALMAWQAIFAIGTFLFLFWVWLWWPKSRRYSGKDRNEDFND